MHCFISKQGIILVDSSLSKQNLHLCSVWPRNLEGNDCIVEEAVQIPIDMFQEEFTRGEDDKVKMWIPKDKCVGKAVSVKCRVKMKKEEWIKEDEIVRMIKFSLLNRFVCVGATIELSSIVVTINTITYAPSNFSKIIGKISNQTFVSVEVISETKSTLVQNNENSFNDDCLIGFNYFLNQIRDILKFRFINFELPRGFLIVGQNGSGRTLSITKIAREVSAKLFIIDPLQISHEEEIVKVFASASSEQFSIILLKKLELLCPSRVTATENTRYVALLLTLLDGMDTSKKIFVFGTTENPLQIDPALRRNGRFDKEIRLDVPDFASRFMILNKICHNDKIDINALALDTNGFILSDLILLHNNAVYLALKDNQLVSLSHYQEALKTTVPSSLVGFQFASSCSSLNYNDIGGLKDVKLRLKQALEWPLLHADAFKRLSVKSPRGILLYGPSGCGKTTLVKCMAAQVGVSFLVADIASVYSSYLGDSEEFLRKLFAKARSNAPCVIFFDEIDSITIKRESGSESVSNRILSTLLNEMDGVEKSGDIIVVGATNRPELLDAALLRPGRFELNLYVPPPDKDSRLELLQILLSKQVNSLTNENVSELVSLTLGYSSSDITALCREAGMQCLRNNLNTVTMTEYMHAIETVKSSLSLDQLASYATFQQ